MQARARIALEGIVQGVGFRPFVHRLAASFNLTGWVLNSSRGVIIEVEGDKERLDGFCRRLLSSPPPLWQGTILWLEDTAILVSKRSVYYPVRNGL